MYSRSFIVHLSSIHRRRVAINTLYDIASLRASDVAAVIKRHIFSARLNLTLYITVIFFSLLNAFPRTYFSILFFSFTVTCSKRKPKNKLRDDLDSEKYPLSLVDGTVPFRPLFRRIISSAKFIRYFLVLFRTVDGAHFNWLDRAPSIDHVYACAGSVLVSIYCDFSVDNRNEP